MKKPYEMRLKVSQENLDKFVELVKSGVPVKKAGEQIGVSRGFAEKYVKRFQIPHCNKTGPRNASGHPNWGGGRIVDKNGYVKIYMPEHPYCERQRNRRKRLYGRTSVCNYVYEHHLVIEKQIGRFLKDGEVVHHKNKVKDDNRIENLELFSSNAEHLACELAGKCPKWSPVGIKNIVHGIGNRKLSKPDADWYRQMTDRYLDVSGTLSQIP